MFVHGERRIRFTGLHQMNFDRVEVTTKAIHLLPAVTGLWIELGEPFCHTRSSGREENQIVVTAQGLV